MVKDAEAHAEEDRKARELVEARNQADAMTHNVRKTLAEHGDKLAAGEKEKIEAAIQELEEVAKGDDKDAIQKKTEALMQASHKLAEQMYAKAGGEQAQAGAAETATASAPGGEKENVVDAQFEEVKDNKNK
jgi:molecular chaperone DnaK